MDRQLFGNIRSRPSLRSKLGSGLFDLLVHGRTRTVPDLKKVLVEPHGGFGGVAKLLGDLDMCRTRRGHE